jgi:hypothetical protein
MHGFANAGYFLTLGFLSVIGSMAFWFRDIISEGRAKNFSFNVVLCNYKLNTAKAIPKEEIKQILDNYSKDISNLRVKRLSNDEFGYYIAGLLEGDGHISLPALGITKLSRILNPRIVFTIWGVYSGRLTNKEVKMFVKSNFACEARGLALQFNAEFLLELSSGQK